MKETACQLKKNRYPFLAGIYRLNKGDYVINETNPTGKLGESYPNVLLKELGELCGFESRITSRSGRRTGATKVAASGASASHQAQFTRHAADPITGSTVLPLYQENTKESANRVTASLLVQPNVLKETGQFFDPEEEEETLAELFDDDDKKPSPEELVLLKKKSKKKKKKSKKKKQKMAIFQQQQQQMMMQQQYMQQQSLMRMSMMPMGMPMMGMPAMGMGMGMPMGNPYASLTQGSSTTDSSTDTEQS